MHHSYKRYDCEIAMKTKVRTITCNNKGFTLVELLVASTIAILCISSIVTMLIRSREIETGDRYRRYARALVISELEDSKYHHTQYTTLKTSVGTTTKNVIIDTRGNYDDIQGTMTVSIGAEDVRTSSDGVDFNFVPISVTISWSTTDGNDSITLTKTITRII